MKRKFLQSDNKGFTLVEALVAISIFTVSVLGLLVVLSQGVTNANYAKQKMTASYLAQEGVEYIRNMRDTYMLYDAGGSSSGWNNFKVKLTSGGCVSNNGCYFDDQNLNYSSHSQTMIAIPVSNCTFACPGLLYNEATGKYGYTGSVASGFVRQIKMTQINSDEVKIFSTVSWTQGSGNFSITLSENMFKWIE